MRSQSLSVNKYESEPELCSFTMGTVHHHPRESRWVLTVVRRYLSGLQSGTQTVATVESEESSRGVKHFGPGDKITPTLPSLGKRQYSLKVGHLFRKANVDHVPARKPLLALCSLMDA